MPLLRACDLMRWPIISAFIRCMHAVHMSLGTEWRENIDFVVLDPNDDTGHGNFDIILDHQSHA